mmetsp:Transcript_1959/g.4432  ORF Transcript_1959/g.4432 Transcript_1959/m.4432 type:complete len:220 (+) Transcript_1959:307-966(+)
MIEEPRESKFFPKIFVGTDSAEIARQKGNSQTHKFKATTFYNIINQNTNMAPLADIQSVIDYNDNTNNLYPETKAYPLHYESTVRKVSFSAAVAEYDIEQASDYSDEEREAIWYSIAHLKELKKKAKRTAKKISEGQLDPNGDDSWTSRGLEGRTTEGIQERYQIRTSAWAAVFLLQEEQENKGTSDPEFLAEVYSEYTTVSQCVARLRGKQDAKSAEQ